MSIIARTGRPVVNVAAAPDSSPEVCWRLAVWRIERVHDVLRRLSSPARMMQMLLMCSLLMLASVPTAHGRVGTCEASGHGGAASGSCCGDRHCQDHKHTQYIAFRYLDCIVWEARSTAVRSQTARYPRDFRQVIEQKISSCHKAAASDLTGTIHRRAAGSCSSTALAAPCRRGTPFYADWQTGVVVIRSAYQTSPGSRCEESIKGNSCCWLEACTLSAAAIFQTEGTVTAGLGTTSITPPTTSIMSTSAA